MKLFDPGDVNRDPVKCLFCEHIIHTWKTGEPALDYKGKSICFDCYLDLPRAVYRMAGMGDGGIIHLIFADCLRSNHNKKYRRSLKQNKVLFNKLLEKYNFKCVECGSVENLTIDHIKPASKGGDDNDSNLQIMCRSCNSRKGAKWNE